MIPPGKNPNHVSIISNASFPIPLTAMHSPMKINKGTAINIKCTFVVYDVVANMINPSNPHNMYMAIRDKKPRPNATGIPLARNISKLENRITPVNHHSIGIYPLSLE
jgi:hypothetical protein